MYIGDHYKSATTFFSADINGMAKFLLNADNLAIFNTLVEKEKVQSILKDIIDASTGEIPDVDFIIDALSWSYGDVNKIDPMVGNTFHIHFLGKEPVVAHISGVVIDLVDKDYKKNIMLLYQHLFRATKVAAHKVVPTLQCMGYFMEGCITSIDFLEKSDMQDVITISMNYQVLRMKIVSDDNKTGFKLTTIEYM